MIIPPNPIEDRVVVDPTHLDHIISPVDLEELYLKSPGAKILNQGHLVAKQLSADIIHSVFDNTEDGIPYVPHCSCGRLKSQFFAGVRCPECGTIVTTAFVNKLAHQAWLGIPDNMPPVLHPVWYQILRSWTSIKENVSLLDIVLNPSAPIPPDLQSHVQGQGYAHFHQNVDMYMEAWFQMFRHKKNTVLIQVFYQTYRNIMFTTKLPILHNSLHPMIKGSSTLSYADPGSRGIVKAAYDLSAITFKIGNTTTTKKEVMNALYDIYKSVIEYYEYIIQEKISKKHAILRKHCFGSRCHFTGRAVIVPIVGAHRFNEIHLPWKLVVNAFKLEIINRLRSQHGYSIPEAVATQLGALIEYNELVHQVLLDLKQEHPNKAFPFLMGRNPTLRLFSIQLLDCPHFKIDPHDQTIGISGGNVTGMNADFDGDETWVMSMKEMALVRQLQTIHPREAVLDTNSFKVSTLIIPPKQSLISMQLYLQQNPDDGYEVIRRMATVA